MVSTPVKQIAEALCAADAILSLLHHRYRNELSEQNQADVKAAADKLAALRSWYEPGLRQCIAMSPDGRRCDLFGLHEEHLHSLTDGATLYWGGRS